MFGTSGIRGPIGEVVTAETALAVGRALAAEGHDRVVLGHDVRTTSPYLADSLSAGLREYGSTVIEVGRAATPTVARSVSPLDADAGVVVTASHNPPADNGIKLWTPSGMAFGPDRQAAIERRLEAGPGTPAQWDEVGSLERGPDVREQHLAAITDSVTVPSPPSVIVDVGNGCGGIAAAALVELGCAVRTLHAQPDGAFPGRPSEPTRETLTDLRSLVRETDANLGVALDGDADRLVAVDDRGRFVPKDVLLALLARDVAGEGDTVAVPVDTSLAVDDALAAVGASVTRTPVGDVHVARRAAESGVVFGGEPSGAWIWPTETLSPDGPLAACKLAALVAGTDSLAATVDAVETYPIDRTSIRADEPAALVASLESTVDRRYEDVMTLDGLRVRHEDGWFLIRASGTEPLVRITAEGRSERARSSLLEEARDIVEGALDR